MPTPTPAPANAVADDEDDDYMNMTILEPATPKVQETYTQRRLRKQREAETRGRTQSKAELAAASAAARDAALATSLLDKAGTTTSKGLAMMAKMGFRPGVALGARDNVGARTEPLGICIKEDRGGIGLDAQRKRRFGQELERERKRVKAEEGEFRERVRREREDGRVEGLVGTAMRVAERMYDEREEEEEEAQRVAGQREDRESEKKGKRRTVSTKPLKSINVLWRGLVRKREEKERDRRMRYDLQQSLSRLPTYEDADEDKDDRKALGRDVVPHALVEDLEEEDPELDAFMELEPAERLHKLVLHLREQHNYCFWCKYTYPDKGMDGCPGLTEKDHD